MAHHLTREGEGPPDVKVKCVHYVAAHRSRPPQQFIDAVEAALQRGVTVVRPSCVREGDR